jgi:hypothetical protein
MVKSSGMQHFILLSRSSSLEDLQSISMHYVDDLFSRFSWSAETNLSGKRSALDSESMQDISCQQRMKIRVPDETRERCEEVQESSIKKVCDVNMLQSRDGPEVINRPDPNTAEPSTCLIVDTHHLCWIFFTSGDLARTHVMPPRYP